ncbi:hypothetical protein DL767_010704 [Monosporascus sp. MG133]|nr:hypothetical protein DL767_010704 [Monosporascus sp. MG133]
MKPVTSKHFLPLLACSTASAYLITGDSVNCRDGPGTSFKVLKTYQKGHDVSITCQTEGTDVSGNTIWDKTSDGCYVADYYVKTGSNGYVTDKCTNAPLPPPTCGAPKSNAATVNLIADFEGFVPNIYLDTNGDPTVGYGHLCKKTKCAEVKYPIPLSVADGKKLLAEDMASFEKCVTEMTNDRVTLNDNQYGAVVSWSFNVGCGAAKSSSLIRRLNAGEKPSTVLPEELIKWINDNNGPLEGLRRRRKAEIALSQKATTEVALPPVC